MSPILIPQTMFSIVVVLVGALATCACAVYYFRHVRMERPTIGTFNGRDIVALIVLIVGLPLLYLVLPPWALTSFLVITFLASLSIGYKPLLPANVLWTLIAALLGGDIWLARTQLGTVQGWQLYWTLTSIIVLFGAVSIVNLYVQGGMRLRHVAYFAFMLAFYDAFFSMVVPLTPKLADAFLGRPLDPSIGMRMTLLGANIGIGDLLIYGLFTVTAYKAYSKIGGWVAIGTVAVFGSIIPACAPLMLAAVIRGGLNVVVPAQTFFGPAALVAYLWLRRRGPERTMAQYLASTDVGRELTPLRLRRPVVSPVPAAVANSAPSGGRPVGERV